MGESVLNKAGSLSACYGTMYDGDVEPCQQCKEKDNCADLMLRIAEEAKKGGPSYPKKAGHVKVVASALDTYVVGEDLHRWGLEGRVQEFKHYYLVRVIRGEGVQIRKKQKGGMVQLVLFNKLQRNIADQLGFNCESRAKYAIYYVPSAAVGGVVQKLMGAAAPSREAVS